MDAIDKAAFQLYQTFWIAQGLLPHGDWSLVSKGQQEGWRAVAERFADMLDEYMVIYGYNGKEPYENKFDKLINNPDHR